MFNLERAVSDWRKQMLAAGMKASPSLEELEDHLREEIAEQVQSGRNEADAFTHAAQKIGAARTVQGEFKKVETAGEERRRKAGQFWAGAILGGLQLMTIEAVLFNSEMTFNDRLSGLAAMALSLVLAAVVGGSHRFFPVISDRRTRMMASFISGLVPVSLWTPVMAHFFLTGHEFPFGSYLATLLWVFCPPLGAVLGLIFSFETAAYKKTGRAAAN